MNEGTINKIALEYTGTQLSRTKKQNLIDAIETLRTRLNDAQSANNDDLYRIAMKELEDELEIAKDIVGKLQEKAIEYKNHIQSLSKELKKGRIEKAIKETEKESWYKRLINKVKFNPTEK